MKKEILFLAAFVLLVSGIFVFLGMKHSPASQGAVSQPIAHVSFLCDGDKNIDASFYEGSSTPSISPDQPPTPGGSVSLILSDGRTLRLAQTISADGGRYSNADESFVFWNKGNGALVLEHGAESTFTHCVLLAPPSETLSKEYEGAGVYSIRYPQGFTVDPSYTYQEMGPGTALLGVKFTIDPQLAAGTNLSSDSYLSVESLPPHVSCDATHFLSPKPTAHQLDDAGVTYSVASSNDAAVGNRYEEYVYALPGTDPCIAVRYFIHYGAIENYPEGSVKSFDRDALTTLFDSIRHSLIINE